MSNPAATRDNRPAAASAAYLDVDGTLAKTHIVGPLVFFHRRLLRPVLRELWLASLPPRGLYWLLLDKLSRDASNRSIYACYAGLDAARVKALAEDCHREFWRPRLYPEALRRLEELRAQGIRLVLVTGSLDFLVAPLARDLRADLIAPALEEKDGVFTGRLDPAPLAGARKAEAVRKHAAAHGVDLALSYSYGDAAGDIPMLECVGHPTAVNPGRRLRAVARRRGWPIVTWRLKKK